MTNRPVACVLKPATADDQLPMSEKRTASIYVDGRRLKVDASENLLQACLSAGLDLPYFCWHPALGSVGACRQCAVKQFKDEHDRRGKIVMACMTAVKDGLRVSVDDAEAKAFRSGVIEWMMTNHPHDCPVCDEGGECHLQDMTVMIGHTYRRFSYPKRTFRNQDLGPFLNHEMNRCITCYRCVRFYREYAGGRDLDAFASKNHVYFGRAEDGTLESLFSGNLVEVCPTGVFTDKTLKTHYTRKWDLQTTPSVCVHCAVGCNTLVGERYGSVRRILNRYNRRVNGYFLCDRGRFGYEFVNSERRIERPLVRDGGTLVPTGRESALGRVRELLASASGVVAIGSPRASIESNYALRALVGPENWSGGSSAKEQSLLERVREILTQGPTATPTLDEIEAADAVLVLGEDVSHTAPRIALALRQAARSADYRLADELEIPRWQDHSVRDLGRQAVTPFFVVGPHASMLDDVASLSHRAAVEETVRLGYAIAHHLSSDAVAVPALAEETHGLAAKIASAFREARRPLVVSGTGAASVELLEAAANVAWATSRNNPDTRLSLCLPECNSLGIALMGGAAVGGAFTAVEEGRADTLLVVENDLFRRAPGERVRAVLEHAAHVIVVDHLFHDTCAEAEVVLPAATFAEGAGSLVNAEGRVQRFFRACPEAGEARDSWRWLNALEEGGDADGPVLDRLIEGCAAEFPPLAGMRDAAADAQARWLGQKIPRQSHRYSGRTAMHAPVDMHEPAPRQDPDAPLAFSMEGYSGMPPGSLLPRYWAPSWNSVQALNRFRQEVGGELVGGDPGVRLLEPVAEAQTRFYRNVPSAFQRGKGRWRLIAVYPAFGTDELGVASPSIAERIEPAHVHLHPEDALGLEAEEGTEVEITAGDWGCRLPVRISDGLVPGVAGIPIGLPDMGYLPLPVEARINKVEQA
jgi:NADH-quinone oxidoreductase subunit G